MKAVLVKTLRDGETCVYLHSDAVLIDGPSQFDQIYIPLENIDELIEALQKAKKLLVLK